MKSHWFSTPNGLDQQQVTVGFLRREVDSKTVPAFGTWKRLSAEESIIAFFEAAAAEAQKVEAGAAGDQLQEWLGHCLSCPVLIRVVADSQEMEWVAQQLREDQTQLSFLARTPTQRVFDVMQKREAMGVAYTPEALLQLYDEKLKFSAKSEKITKGPLLLFIFLCTERKDFFLATHHPYEQDFWAMLPWSWTVLCGMTQFCR